MYPALGKGLNFPQTILHTTLSGSNNRCVAVVMDGISRVSHRLFSSGFFARNKELHVAYSWNVVSLGGLQRHGHLGVTLWDSD
jgi:hypothetical protein